MKGFHLEVDSVADLRVPVLDQSDVEGEIVDARPLARFVVRSITGSVSVIITARASVVADAAWHRELVGQGSRAGTIWHCDHAISGSWRLR